MRKRVGALVLLGLVSAVAPAQSSSPAGRAGVEAFNRALENATRSMNPAATLALWDDDGVSLLPSTKPIVGKKAIAQLFANVMASLQGARMQTFALQCFDIAVSGDWASEWCTEHQIVVLPGGKQPLDGWGKMLLVLHRGADGTWRLRQEMWNQAIPGDTLH